MPAETLNGTSNRSRVETYVVGHRPRPVCARCIAAALTLRLSAVQRAATMLEGFRDYVRENALCSLCGKNRLVIRARAGTEAAR